VTISSIHKDDLYPTPELKNILVAAERLRMDFTMNWERERDTALRERVIKNLEAIRESLILHSKEIYSMEEALMAAASARLTGKQRMLLQWLADEYRGDMVYTVLIGLLSSEFGIPRSTVRWNLRGLREAGLIIAGDKEKKGIPVALTNSGRTLADYLGQWKEDAEHI
jgi:DNA-binding transcriptional ArsR family regulator